MTTHDPLADVPTGTPDEDGWDQPVPLSSVTLPPFPVGVLPDWLAHWARAVSVSLQVPVDLPALMALAVCSAAVAGKVQIEMTPRYTEPLNLWIVCALPSANVKSGTVRFAVAPVMEWEADEAERTRDQIAEASTRRSVREGARDKAMRSAGGATDHNERLRLEADAIALAKEVEHLHVPSAPRLLADDATAERLATLLMEHKGRMAIISPEGDVFDLMGGRYSNNIPNIGVYLRGHAGDPIKVDRQGRAPDFVAQPALTMGISPQPDVLRGLTGKQGFRGRGLLARFLYSLPVSLVGERDWDRAESAPIPVPLLDAYQRRVRALLSVDTTHDTNGRAVPHTLRPSPQALELWRSFRRQTETQLRAGHDLAALQDWGGKLWGASARLAGVLHCIEHAAVLVDSDAMDWPVSASTMEAALAIARYFVPHAHAAFNEMGSDGVTDEARWILRWIERQGISSFSKRDCFRAAQGHVDKADDLDPALARLCEHGYIRPRPAVATGSRPGKPASPMYDVNPLDNIDQIDQTAHLVNLVNIVNHPEPSLNGHGPTDEEMDAWVRKT